jgi:hypothetical protein
MKGTHWIRQYLISETSITLIKYELQHMRQNMISTPDSEASYNKILDTLDKLRSA